jgi:hypothetical protein
VAGPRLLVVVAFLLLVGVDGTAFLMKHQTMAMQAFLFP